MTPKTEQNQSKLSITRWQFYLHSIGVIFEFSYVSFLIIRSASFNPVMRIKIHFQKCSKIKRKCVFQKSRRFFLYQRKSQHLNAWMEGWNHSNEEVKKSAKSFSDADDKIENAKYFLIFSDFSFPVFLPQKSSKIIIGVVLMNCVQLKPNSRTKFKSQLQR
jgi:hypothetical protein